MTKPADDLDHESEYVEGLEEDLDLGNPSRTTYNEDPKAARTLLPSPLASLVSLTTATSLLSLRAATFFGSFAINAARTGTLTGFELGRVIFEGILARAGNDLAASSTGAVGQAAAEGLLQKAVCIYGLSDSRRTLVDLFVARDSPLIHHLKRFSHVDRLSTRIDKPLIRPFDRPILSVRSGCHPWGYTKLKSCCYDRYTRATRVQRPAYGSAWGKGGLG